MIMYIDQAVTKLFLNEKNIDEICLLMSKMSMIFIYICVCTFLYFRTCINLSLYIFAHIKLKFAYGS